MAELQAGRPMTALGGPAQQRFGASDVARYAVSAQIKQGERGFGLAFAAAGRVLEPAARLAIARRAFADEVQMRRSDEWRGNPLRGGPGVPFDGLCRVARHARPAEIGIGRG